MISLKIYHGGVFSPHPSRKYLLGKCQFVDLVDTDEFSVYELNAMMKEIGYTDDDDVATFYHFKILGSDLDYGLRALGNDLDVLNLLKNDFDEGSDDDLQDDNGKDDVEVEMGDFDDNVGWMRHNVLNNEMGDYYNNTNEDGMEEMVFGSKEGIKKMIDTLAIETTRQIVLVKNDASRIRAVCWGIIPELGGPSKVKKMMVRKKRCWAKQHQPSCGWAKQEQSSWALKKGFAEGKREILGLDGAFMKGPFPGQILTAVGMDSNNGRCHKQLVDGRDKPIITCLEYIRHYLMKRIVNVQKLIEKSDGPLTPNAADKLKEIKTKASKYLVQWNGDDEYQISPINGRKLWPKSGGPTIITAPKHHTQVSRPKKKRKKSVDETCEAGCTETKNKLRRIGKTVTYEKCKKKGHNSRSCKGQ
ncbi:hypothetical protein OSB04_006289 [Centaurea solstitialis]|uniref:PB1-like domain-containing protein n=1 Tax=Centaurea solstitialis TaxID=347529 RepID=A0AA38TJD7_9ASTR|nr:hypothetical protein OSB04_006289 [Centaurea solstitialis]